MTISRTRSLTRSSGDLKVGDLRELIAHMPDELSVSPSWYEGHSYEGNSLTLSLQEPQATRAPERDSSIKKPDVIPQETWERMDDQARHMTSLGW